MQADFRGFFSDQTMGNTLEVVSVWNAEIYDVDHVPVDGPVPESLPERLLAPLLEAARVRATLSEPVELVDPATGFVYYVRRVGDPEPLLARARADWSIPATMTLLLLVAFGIGAVITTTRLLASDEPVPTTPVPREYRVRPAGPYYIDWTVPRVVPDVEPRSATSRALKTHLDRLDGE